MKEFERLFKKEILELARKHKLKQSEVLDIYWDQWKFIRKSMKEDYDKSIEDRRSIRLQGLGTFRFNSYIANLLTERKKKKNDREVLQERSSSD